MTPANITYLMGQSTKLNYLNSGSIVGRASSFAKLSTYLTNMAKSNEAICTADDQGALSAAFRFQEAYKAPVAIRLDHDGIITSSGHDGCSEYKQVGKRWQSTVNGVISAAIHYNGGGKACMVSHYKTGEMPSKQAGTILWDGNVTALNDVCGSVPCQTDAIGDFSSCGKREPVVCWVKSRPSLQ